ncbi:MAG: hypothetical protein D6769_01665 [Methanobacteriota archaeon]|nr:MAG: hypothetical protein D6769_01665 [Euryarchaeota archaeon]
MLSKTETAEDTFRELTTGAVFANNGKRSKATSRNLRIALFKLLSFINLVMVVMRFLAIADLHDSWSNLKLLSKKVVDYDALFMCGDIATSRESAEKVISHLEGNTVFYVPGNGESHYIEKMFRKAGMSIHGEVISFGGYDIAGFGYSPPTPFGTPGELPEEEIRKKMEELKIREKSILITHCPPEGILDNGFGSYAIREYVERERPALHLFGHVHEIAETEKIGRTLFVNCPPAMRGWAVEIRAGNEIEVEFTRL